MKENGMCTLVELLNEYEKHISKGGLADLREFDGTLNYYSNYEDEYVFDNVYYRIISKGYGFIQWLVENNKIDESKIEIHWFSFYESVLMELAIQDNPIEFLISILK